MVLCTYELTLSTYFSGQHKISAGVLNFVVHLYVVKRSTVEYTHPQQLPSAYYNLSAYC